MSEPLTVLQVLMERLTTGPHEGVSVYGVVHASGTIQLTIKGAPEQTLRVLEDLAYPPLGCNL